MLQILGRDRITLIMSADGACFPNPGQGSFGVEVRRPDGGLVCRMRKDIGHATNNIAEWRALIAALDYALASKTTRFVRIQMDSQLVVRQINGRWSIRDEKMQELAGVAKRSLRRLVQCGVDVQIYWVRRERNRAADALAARRS